MIQLPCATTTPGSDHGAKGAEENFWLGYTRIGLSGVVYAPPPGGEPSLDDGSPPGGGGGGPSSLGGIDMGGGR